MNKLSKIAVAVLAVGVVTSGAVIARGGPGAGYGPGGGYGHGAFCNQNKAMMMQRGRGGMKGMGMGRHANRDLNLTESQVKTLVEARLIMRGNDRLKLGKVAKKDDQTYLVDIVTVDNSLVRQVEIDKNTGRRAWRTAQQQ